MAKTTPPDSSFEHLRRDVMDCLRAATAAVEPAALVSDFLAARPELLGGESRVSVAAVGKAAQAMMSGARRVLAERIHAGVVIAPEGTVETGTSEDLEVFGGGHPVPNEAGVRGAETIRQLASDLGEDDVLLCLISGGGSALMTLPEPGLSLADLRATTDALLRSGATIQQLNCVRKHLDQLKGGGLAVAAAPARIVALVLSDVVGDPLDVIASGPVSPDPTTFTDALQVLAERELEASLPVAVRSHLTCGARGERPENPKADDPAFARSEVHIIGSNRLAAAAALARAKELGYETLLLSTVLAGEAREAGQVLATMGLEMLRSGQPLAPPALLLAAGETTVTVRGNGRGGRNQELTLGAALALEDADENLVVASFGTDGIDGPTDAAGAIACGTTAQRARELGFDPVRSLHNNDSHPLFEALGDLIRTGPTGTNVLDLVLVMARP
ncbi:MAG: glycerate kinase [Thermoanaerobaculia bacterium]|nr:glycerate kinase [Thermoanaerobaculia bacterium]